jgi:hypothetical protein
MNYFYRLPHLVLIKINVIFPILLLLTGIQECHMVVSIVHIKYNMSVYISNLRHCEGRCTDGHRTPYTLLNIVWSPSNH